LLSLKNKFVFVHIPKTGGNSLQLVLEKYSDDERSKTVSFHDLENWFDVKGPVTGKKHFTSSEYIDRLGLSAFMRLKKVTFVRNPYDRAMSFYFSPFRWMRDGPEGPGAAPAVFDKASFLRLLGSIGAATSFLSHKGRLLDFDFVGRFENYETDFAEALRVCGVTDVPAQAPHVNRRAANPPILWDREMLEAVERRFADDFNNFGYEARRPFRA
jgi:hypothetical protein